MDSLGWRPGFTRFESHGLGWIVFEFLAGWRINHLSIGQDFHERLAASLDRPEAARAVAGAISRNPISWIVPCHRVIRSTGAVTGYRWGPIRKRAMLGWESAQSELQDAVA